MELRKYRDWIPFVGFLSCPVCNHRYVTLRERCTNVPTGCETKPCPNCGTQLSYAKWAVYVLRVWCLLIAGILLIFPLGAGVAMLDEPVSAWFFSAVFRGLFYTLLPMAGATSVAMAWGCKLRAKSP